MASDFPYEENSCFTLDGHTALLQADMASWRQCKPHSRSHTKRVGEVLFKTRATLSLQDLLLEFAFVTWICLTIVLHAKRHLQKQI